jgi:hypothetical protein
VFCVKMATLARGATSSDDALSDAAVYLNHTVMKHASSPMTLKMVKAWVRSYQMRWDSAVFRDISKFFHEKYGQFPWEKSQETQGPRPGEGTDVARGREILPIIHEIQNMP